MLKKLSSQNFGSAQGGPSYHMPSPINMPLITGQQITCDDWSLPIQKKKKISHRLCGSSAALWASKG